MTIVGRLRTAAAIALLLAAAGAQQPEAPAAAAPAAPPPQVPVATRRPVGMPGELTGVVLPGSEFAAAPSTPASKVVVRITAVQPHGTAHRYDLEFVGLEPGDYDLGAFLVRKDRTDNGPLPPLPIAIDSTLPADRAEPVPLPAVPAPPLGGYRTLLWIAGATWGLGLLLILFVGRRRRPVVAAAAPPPTLAERLQPLVRKALAGNLPDPDKRELERLLLGYWQQRLELTAMPLAAAIAAMRAHPTAGALLRELEQWLHADPATRAPVDEQALLRPYRELAGGGGPS